MSQSSRLLPDKFKIAANRRLVPLHLSESQTSAKFPRPRNGPARPDREFRPSRDRRQPGKEAPGMNRRTAMLLTMLMGGILPRGVFAQDPARRELDERADQGHPAPPRIRPRHEDRPPSSPTRRHTDDSQAEPATSGVQAMPAEPGQRCRQFDISRYTRLDHSQPNPQNAIVEWIFRRTGTAPWHGEKLAVLSASRSQIRAYNNAKVLDQTTRSSNGSSMPRTTS